MALKNFTPFIIPEKKAVLEHVLGLQMRGAEERKPEAYLGGYGEGLSDEGNKAGEVSGHALRERVQIVSSLLEHFVLQVNHDGCVFNVSFALHTIDDFIS